MIFAKVTVALVAKNLLGVRALVNSVREVIMKRAGSFVRHWKTGRVQWMREVSGVLTSTTSCNRLQPGRGKCRPARRVALCPLEGARNADGAELHGGAKEESEATAVLARQSDGTPVRQML